MPFSHPLASSGHWRMTPSNQRNEFPLFSFNSVFFRFWPCVNLSYSQGPWIFRCKVAFGIKTMYFIRAVFFLSPPPNPFLLVTSFSVKLKKKIIEIFVGSLRNLSVYATPNGTSQLRQGTFEAFYVAPGYFFGLQSSPGPHPARFFNWLSWEKLNQLSCPPHQSEATYFCPLCATFSPS